MNSFKQGDRIVFRFPATLDRDTAQVLNDFFETRILQGEKSFLGDATNLTYVDSFGISSIIKGSKFLVANGGELQIRELHGQPLTLMRQSGVLSFLTLTGPMEENRAEPALTSEPEIVSEKQNGCHILAFRGTFFFPSGSSQLKARMLSLSAGSRSVILDFTGLLYMDSVAGNEILKFNREIKLLGGEVRICGCNFVVEDILKALNMGAVIRIFPTRSQACSLPFSPG